MKNNMDNRSNDSTRGHIEITPQMIRAAIKKLQFWKAYVNSNLISEYLHNSYPVDNNIKTFREELNKKLNCAVRVGLIIKHGENSYCLPTLRQEAYALKTAFTAFWEMYKNYNESHTLRNKNPVNKHPTIKKRKHKVKYFNCKEK